ncbi:LINE-1 reverse transcriptase isogeny [Sesbania bispinosa]|nr:LINE-1 reverse transcriptase isogeny [Sesbania bispinosa]
MNVLDKCNLLNVDFFGNKFMWQRPSVEGNLISRRLDKALCNKNWRVHFPGATLEVLFRLHFDHSPILRRCGPIQRRHGARPYRFEVTWASHNEYTDIVRRA